MFIGRKTRWLILGSAYFWLLSIAPAQAYIDPGSGSYLFQLLMGAALAAGITVKMFWQRIKSAVGSLFSRRRSSPNR